MKRLLCAILLLGLLSVACTLSQFGIVNPASTTTALVEVLTVQVSNATMIYYEVSGTTAAELRTQLNQKGPLDPIDGLHYDARTDWYISWTWPGYGESECDLSKVSVSYDIKVTVPHWKPAAGADQKLIEQWNRYLNNLALHEQGHMDNVVNNYLRVKDTIQKATCITAEQVAQDMLNTLRSTDIEYDRKTKHGETHGAKFP